ncbi:hypothetical protein Pmani_023047 [Petrolisthes manimaculis]|uniref:Uncharacterized protein n=1 Tax=Petrolisthes manimaculis TaxID=1843537 RepID=A0AAE1U0L1_9EUCA|nr:hypothetical protein Pmani_023047 [Petrolisthes manimaculis]
MGSGVGSVLEERLWIEKTCLFHFHYSEEVCKNLSGGQHPQEQLDVHRQMALYHLYQKLITHVPSIPVVLLLGTWSDLRGRRMPIVLTLLSFTLGSLGVVANSWWWTLPPEYLLLCNLPVGLSGGHAAFVMAYNAYLSTATGNKERTTRFSLIMVVLSVGMSVGKAVSLLLFQHGGYITVFATQTVLTATAVLYCLAFLKERPGDTQLHQQPSSSTTTTTLGVWPTLKRSVSVMLRHREDGVKRRVLVHAMILWFLLYSVGSWAYGFLYTIKKFNWDYNTYTSWGLMEGMGVLFGQMVVLPVLSLRCGAEDALLGFIGTVSMIFSYTLIATAPQPWVLYIASVVGCCNEMVGCSSRSALSKLVPKEEQGALFAVMACGKTVIPILSSLTFSTLYRASVSSFPGAGFAVTAAAGVVLAGLQVCLLTTPRGRPNQDT